MPHRIYCVDDELPVPRDMQKRILRKASATIDTRFDDTKPRALWLKEACSVPPGMLSSVNFTTDMPYCIGFWPGFWPVVAYSTGKSLCFYNVMWDELDNDSFDQNAK